MNKNKGFTLTELLGTIVILSLLIAVAIPVYFNITKSVKNNEYTSVKNRIESLALRYVEENNLENVSYISVNRLISNGYLSADKYVEEEGSELAYVINPIDNKENLACRIIEIIQENYEYKAKLTNENDCSFTSQEQSDDKLSIRAYELDGNKIGKMIGFKKPNELEWTNKDVLIVVDSTYNDDTEINYSYNGNINPISNENKMGVINENDILDTSKSNIIVVKAEIILQSVVNINAKTEGKLNTTKIKVKIDKEVPITNNEVYDGWTSEEKKAIIYISDGNGSGGKGVYITEEADISQIRQDEYYEAQDGVVVIENPRFNGEYYVWAVDNATNKSVTPSKLTIKNVAITKPEGGLKVESTKSGYNASQIAITLSGVEESVGIKEVCYLINDSDINNCNWKALTNDVYQEITTIPGAVDGKGTEYKIYGFVKDNLDRVVQAKPDGKEYFTYKLYTECESDSDEHRYYVDGTNCSMPCNNATLNRIAYDKHTNVLCSNFNKNDGGSACNKEWCYYTVAYDKGTGNGGSMSNQQMICDKNKSYTDPNLCNNENQLNSNGFSKTGYSFQNWNGTYENRAKVKGLAKVYQTASLTANWTPNTFTVAYNGNYATGGSTASHNCTYDSACYLSGNGYGRTGYSFAGWKLNNSGGTLGAGANITNVVTSGTATYYAQWNPNTFTVAYNGNGATGGWTGSHNCTYDSACYLAGNGYSRTGYYFAGWKLNNSGGTLGAGANITNVAASGTVTYYAQWNINTYTITYNANGGSVSPGAAAVNHGGRLNLPTPSRSGYNFAGWYTDPNGGSKVDNNTTWTGNATIYAHWSAANYTITYNPNGGNGSMSSQSVSAGSSVQLSYCLYYMNGYNFKGWSTSPGGSATISDGANYTPSGNVTLYAVWGKEKGILVYMDTYYYSGSGAYFKYNGTTYNLKNTYGYLVLNNVGSERTNEGTFYYLNPNDTLEFYIGTYTMPGWSGATNTFRVRKCDNSGYAIASSCHGGPGDNGWISTATGRKVKITIPSNYDGSKGYIGVRTLADSSANIANLVTMANGAKDFDIQISN